MQEEDGVFQKSQIETFLPRSFVQLNDCISKILKDNNIKVESAEEKLSDERIKVIVKTVMNLQNRVL